MENCYHKPGIKMNFTPKKFVFKKGFKWFFSVQELLFLATKKNELGDEQDFSIVLAYSL